MANLVNALGNIIITHPTFMEAIDRYTQAISSIGRLHNTSVGFALTGDSGTGKTTLAKYLLSLYPGKRDEEGLIRPVVYCSVPPKPTLKGLASALFSALNDPFDSLPNKRGRDAEHVLTERSIKLIIECQVKAIIFDESQHLARNPESDGTYAATDWLKTLMERTQVVIILLGLNSTSLLFEQNEQLERRFKSTIKLSRFNWMQEETRSQFLGILQAFQANLPQFDFMELTAEETSFRFYMATGGLIAYLAQILEQAMLDAIQDNRKTIKLKHFEVAFDKTMHVSDFNIAVNPFSATFKAIPTSTTVAKANLVGAHIPAPRQRKKGATL